MSSHPTSTNLETAPAYWFLNALHLLLAQNETGNDAYSLLHLTAPPGFETPYHLHDNEDEAFYLLDGGLSIICDGKKIIAGPGCYIFLPRGVPHGFRSNSDTDSHVLIHAMPGGKVGFVGMMLAMATPLDDRHNLPQATPPDLERLAALCKQNKITVLGPLPM